MQHMELTVNEKRQDYYIITRYASQAETGPAK